MQGRGKSTWTADRPVSCIHCLDPHMVLLLFPTSLQFFLSPPLFFFFSLLYPSCSLSIPCSPFLPSRSIIHSWLCSQEAVPEPTRGRTLLGALLTKLNSPGTGRVKRFFLSLSVLFHCGLRAIYRTRRSTAELWVSMLRPGGWLHMLCVLVD